MPATPPTHDPHLTEALKSFVAPAVAERLVESGGRLPEERRLITSLFADVSGFTSLSELLDEEQLVDVVDPLISALGNVVGRYDGTVDKYAGDAILALFGAPVNHEDDAERALLVALEMHREVARLREELPHGDQLSLHIGVNSGHAIARVQGSQVRLDYNVLGDAIILAQRLESVAPPGETYVSETVFKLTKHRFDFEGVGDLTLKGKREPVPAWRLVGERSLVESRRSRLVGRDRELTKLDAALDELSRGRGAVVVVSGDAGVGKSRLTAEIRERATDRGFRWYATRCLSYGDGLAYWPYAELMRREPELAEAVSAADRPFLARFAGEEAPEVDELEPEAFRRGLHAAAANTLVRLARERPLVLTIEDVHWADPSSLALTVDLADLCEEHAVLLYLIKRPDAAQVLDELPRAHSIDLGPLDDDGVAAFIGGLLEGEVPAGLAAAVAERTGGNPLFVEEIVAALRETDVLRSDGDTWTMSAGFDALSLPASIEKVLAARIDLLSRSTATVLQEASVIGRRMRVELLAAVAADVPEVGARIRELIERGFLETRVDDDGAPAVWFHHSLIVDVAYGRLLRRTRREMHRRVAEVAETLYGANERNIDLLAQHYYLGGADEKAVPYLVRAGERNRDLFANDEAILHFTRAVELAPDDLDVKLELADLHDLVGNYAEAVRLYRDVRDASGDVRAWCGIAATLRKQGAYAEALEEVEDAFASAAFDGPEASTVSAEQAWTLQLAGRLREAVDVLTAALERADGRSDRTVARLNFQLARALTIQGDYETALRHGRDAEETFEAEGDLRGLAATMRVFGDTYRFLGRLDDAAGALHRGLELAQRVGNVEEIGGCLLGLGIVESMRGAQDAAIASFRRAVDEFEAVGHASGRATAYNNLAYALTLTGDYDEATRYCELTLDVARSIGHTFMVAQAYDTLAAIALAKGDYRDAAARGEEAAELHLEIGALPDAISALETAIDASERAGDASRARSLRERARGLAASQPAV